MLTQTLPLFEDMTSDSFRNKRGGKQRGSQKRGSQDQPTSTAHKRPGQKSQVLNQSSMRDKKLVCGSPEAHMQQARQLAADLAELGARQRVRKSARSRARSLPVGSGGLLSGQALAGMRSTEPLVRDLFDVTPPGTQTPDDHQAQRRLEVAICEHLLASLREAS